MESVPVVLDEKTRVVQLEPWKFAEIRHAVDMVVEMACYFDLFDSVKMTGLQMMQQVMDSEEQVLT